MADALIGVGILLAVFGPLLLIPVIWLVYRFPGRMIINRIFQDRFGKKVTHLIAFAASGVAVMLVLYLSYLPGKLKYDAMCVKHGIPSIQSRVHADGFYRTRLYPYEAKQYLGPDGFAFVEAPHMYKPGQFIKYTLNTEGNIEEEEIPLPTSQYGIRDDLTRSLIGITLSQKTAYILESGDTFAQASSILYDGGPLSLFLGVYGMQNCPDIQTEPGSGDFATYYNFEKEVLLSGSD